MTLVNAAGDGGSPGAVDFFNPFHSFVPASATMTVSNLLGGETSLRVFGQARFSATLTIVIPS